MLQLSISDWYIPYLYLLRVCLLGSKFCFVFSLIPLYLHKKLNDQTDQVS